MPTSSFTAISSVPLRGGMNSYLEAPQLPPGAFSLVQNLRARHPGFIIRPGQREQHTTADSTNQVQTLYQFRKNRISENHLFAQMSDGDILEADTAPPGVTTGAFGDEVFSGSASQKPASWSALDDLLFMSNGVDQHQVYAGQDNYVQMAVVYAATTAAPVIPMTGNDYTEQVTDGLTSTVMVLDAIGTDSDQCLFVCCPVPANRLSFVVEAANGNSVTVTVYRKTNTNTWADVTATDGTASGGATLAQDGTMYWAYSATEVPTYMYGICGFWYKISFSAALDAEVEVSSITYGTDHDGDGTRTSFTAIHNVWDGLPIFAVEAIINQGSVYYTNGTASVTLGDVAFDETGALYISSPYKLAGVYIDVGDTPNTGDATAIDAGYYWSGSAFSAVSSINDGTSGLTKSGWVTWDRIASGEYQHHFQGTQYYAYWYKLEVDDAVSTDVIVSITTMPYFDIGEFGSVGVANCAWGGHLCYSFKRFGQFIYVSALNAPLTLNGTGFGILEAGDGRSNEVIAMSRFHNEMIAWQEEKGVDGGCTTLFEGYSPTTYGKLLLSSRVGIVNAKAYVVVDGVLTSTATDERLRTLAFWISRYGVCVSDGRTVSVISDSIHNHFDQTNSSDCITRGAENQHWIGYDSNFNILRIGLATGGTTTPNKFFCFDLVDKVWYEDSLAQELSCALDVEAGSGNVPTVQVGGGIDDGTVYQLNYGTNDNGTKISSVLDIEVSNRGQVLILDELLLRCKAQSDGEILLSIYENGVISPNVTDLSLSMVAENTNEIVRRHIVPLNNINQHLTIRLELDELDMSMHLYDLGIRSYIWDLR